MLFFSSINLCQVLRKLFEHEAISRVFKHRPRDLASVNAINRYSCIFYLISTETALKTSLEH